MVRTESVSNLLFLLGMVVVLFSKVQNLKSSEMRLGFQIFGFVMLNVY